MVRENITIKEIAKKAGVSIGTVYRALHDRGRISIDTQKKILEIAKDLGYKRNILASALSSSQTKKILAVIQKEPHSFHSLIMEGMKSAEQEMLKYKISVEYVRMEHVNEKTTQEIIHRTKIIEPNGVVLIPSLDMSGFIDSLVNSGVPVITYNSDLKESKRLCYIGQDTYRAGKVAGELMGKLLPQDSKILILTGSNKLESLESRMRGFVDELREEYPFLSIVDTIEYFENESLAKQLVKEYVYKNPDLDGVYVTCFSGTIGVAKAMKELNAEKKPIVIGFDTGAEIEEALYDNRLCATLSQEPFKQGYNAIMFMSKVLLAGWEPEQKQYYTKSSVILKNNVKEESTNFQTDFLDI
jgi:LacI family transcriptional regulator